MARLFIFGIGGTGSRVIKSLTMLLASGVDISADEIIPIVIDPDESNGDLERTLDILQKYQEIRSELDFEGNGFFKTKITTLNQITEDPEAQLMLPNFHFELTNVKNQRFKQFIDIDNLSSNNSALIHALFSSSNLESSMDVGFKGNPNIGSVVLNQIKESKEFKIFSSNYRADDRVFIVSSIFGGTGAAGFPLLAKNIRSAKSGEANKEFLKNSKIGAVCLLPYFGVAKNKNSKINKATFYSKTKAALNYYSRSLSGNKTLNALYYIGDNQTKEYANNEGSKSQKNDAHFVEIAAALSIVDFMRMEDKKLVTANGEALKPVFKEFGIKNSDGDITFSKLGTATKDRIMMPLTQMRLLNLYLDLRLEESVDDQPWSAKGKVTLTNNSFFQDSYFREDVLGFLKHFEAWIKELARNEVSFKPFDLSVTDKNLFELINGVYKKKSLFDKYKSNPFGFFDDRLNRAERQFSDESKEKKFMKIFYTATKAIFDDRFNLKK